MKGFLIKHAPVIIAILIVFVIQSVFTGLYISEKSKQKEEVKIAYNECDKLLKQQGSSADELQKLMKDSDYKYKIMNTNEVLEKVPEPYKLVFYDVMKYNNVCEKGLKLEEGEILSFYYKSLGLEK